MSNDLIEITSEELLSVETSSIDAVVVDNNSVETIDVIIGETILVSDETVDIVSTVEESIITATENSIDVISASEDIVNIISVAEQGPAGPTGPQGNTGPIGPQGPAGPEGISGIQSVNVFVESTLSGNKVVAFTSNGVVYADNTNLSHIGNILGFTRTSSESNSNTSIQTFGFLNGFYGLIPGLPIYLSSNGSITQTVPVTGFINNLGIALSSTELNINITMPIVKE